MTEQVCPTCGPKWNGMYNTDNRCITCGWPTHAVAESPAAPLKIARCGDHTLPLPMPATEQSAAADVRAATTVVMYPGDEAVVGTGFAFQPPQGYALMLLPRSGLGSKHGIVLSNTVGLIDPDYRGEVKAALWYRRMEGAPVTIAKGDRIAQIICVPFLSLWVRDVVTELDVTERGDGGFGSTGDT